MTTSRPIFKFQRGEPITIGREVQSGDPSGYSIVALLKPTRGQIVPPADTAPIALFDAVFEAAAGEVKARWLLTIAGEDTVDMAPGYYVVDAKFMLDGAVASISDPAFITLVESVSG